MVGKEREETRIECEPASFLRNSERQLKEKLVLPWVLGARRRIKAWAMGEERNGIKVKEGNIDTKCVISNGKRCFYTYANTSERMFTIS